MGKKEIVILVLAILALFSFIRLSVVSYNAQNIKFYADEYISRAAKEGKEINVYDDEVIFDKIIPNKMSLFFNPLLWTEEQISSDDELLSECKKAWEIEQKRIQTERESARKTFDERFEKWQKEKSGL